MNDFAAITERALRDLDELSSLDLMRHALSLAVLNVDGCDAAAVSEVQGRRKVSTPAATHTSARHGDVIQYETGQGPCLEAIMDEHIVRVPDIAAEARWPQWAARMRRESGYPSMLVFKLYTHKNTLGALNLYSSQRHGFSLEAEQMGQSLAALTAVAISRDRSVAHLSVALDHRTHIGRAQGILMERFDMDEAAAFATLARISSVTNRKLHQVALELVETRVLPSTAT